MTVREAISTADILAQDLNSVSDGKMLETRGMVYINASSDGQQLKVNSSSPISVKIPGSNATENDFKLFYGASHGDQAMNWKVEADKSFNPAVKTVPIDLDRSMLSGMTITDRVAPDLPKIAGNMSIPVKPTKPRKAIEINEPQRGNLYQASSLERSFNKRKIAVKNEELYQKALHRYEIYQQKQAVYETRLKDYEKAMIAYNDQLKAFDAEGERRINEAKEFFKKRYEYIATGYINTLIKSIQATSISNKTVLNKFTNYRVYQNDMDQADQLKQILGQTYYRYYHYDYPNKVIAYNWDNIWIKKTDGGYTPFMTVGYFGTYDSLIRATHLDDTLAMLQERITQRCVELGLMTQHNVDGYVASVSQLGWINCDRFYETPKDQLVSMKVLENADVRMYMVFSDIKSCLPISRMGNEYVSSLVPIGKTVRIVSVKVVDGKPQMAVSTVNTSNTNPLTLEYKTCSLADIKTNFATL